MSIYGFLLPILVLVSSETCAIKGFIINSKHLVNVTKNDMYNNEAPKDSQYNVEFIFNKTKQDILPKEGRE